MNNLTEQELETLATAVNWYIDRSGPRCAIALALVGLVKQVARIADFLEYEQRACNER